MGLPTTGLCYLPVMKKQVLFFVGLFCWVVSSNAQECIRLRADRTQLPIISRTVSIDRVAGDTVTAYANQEELTALESLGYKYEKVVVPPSKDLPAMANSIDEMRQWNRYPTYETYLSMMQMFADSFPTLCHIDTIGYSVSNRLILSAVLYDHTNPDSPQWPQFFYSSTMHGDEVTGYYLMIRLIDTLLNGFTSNAEFRQLLGSTQVYINPNANPDGTYYRNNNQISSYWQGYSQRYNANDIDLNRNYPDPFGTPPMFDQQRENTVMIDYLSNHRFKVSANLHGGDQVLNYPWDSFTSQERPHPYEDWWQSVCKRFVDTCRLVKSNCFRGVNNTGYIAGGDWYVISNGRQDYVNYYNNCLELTMELSSDKTPASSQLDSYWAYQHRALINYIKEVHNLPYGDNEVQITDSKSSITIFPNPTTDKVHLRGEITTGIELLNPIGQTLAWFPNTRNTVDLSPLPQGIYFLRIDGQIHKIVKK